jgi:hypothetical protein
MRIPFIQKNPVTMVGTLDRCWLFAFRTPLANVQRKLPSVLEPVSYDGHAFWNVVVSHIDRMRPKGAPAVTGVSYWHVAYRLYVRFHPSGGPPIEGLNFTRSDCDSALMTRAGNLVTDFNFHTSTINVEDTGGRLTIDIESPDAPASASANRAAPVSLANGSPFGSLDEAARFLKYKPFGISVGKSGEDINIVRIRRQEDAWSSRLIHVEQQTWSYFADNDVALELCYEVDPIFYTWTRGRVFSAR